MVRQARSVRAGCVGVWSGSAGEVSYGGMRYGELSFGKAGGVV